MHGSCCSHEISCGHRHGFCTVLHLFLTPRMFTYLAFQVHITAFLVCRASTHNFSAISESSRLHPTLLHIILGHRPSKTEFGRTSPPPLNATARTCDNRKLESQRRADQRVILRCHDSQSSKPSWRSPSSSRRVIHLFCISFGRDPIRDWTPPPHSMYSSLSSQSSHRRMSS